MTTKSKRRTARRHPEKEQHESQEVIAATIVRGLLSAVTFGAIDESPNSTTKPNRARPSRS